MTDKLILWELQKIYETLTKTKEERTFNVRMIKPTEKFNSSDSILNATKLSSFRLSVYNSVFYVNSGNNQFLYIDKILAVTPGAYDLTEIAELIKEETNGNVIIEPDNNTMKCFMEMKQSAIIFDIKNSIAPLLGLRKIVYEQGK